MPPTGERVGAAWYELSASDDKLRADLASAEQALRQAGVAGERQFAQPLQQGADRVGDAFALMMRQMQGVSHLNVDTLAASLDKAQREAEESLVALRNLSHTDLPEQDALRYAEAVEQIKTDAGQTAGELRLLQQAQPKFDTPELRQAADGLDRVGKEADQVGAEFRQLAQTNPGAVLAKGAQESKVLASNMDRASKSSEGLIGKLRGVQGVLLGLGVAISAQQIVGFFGDAIESASNLNETVTKTSQIFGKEALPALETWADTAATALGQSKQQALDAASSFAIFGKAAGLSGGELVTFSENLTGLASDFASFFNTSPEDAITGISAALRGEFEPIRQYGVLLDDATIRQKALELGIVNTTKNALTPQQRVLAVQAAIFEQTADAQGDFARTSEGLANQQRISAARMADALADLGDALLPVALGFTRFAADALPKVIDALKGVVSAAIPIGGAFLDLGNEIIPILVAALGIKLVQAFRAAAAEGKLAALATKTVWVAALAIAAENANQMEDFLHKSAVTAVLRKWSVSAKDFGDVMNAVGGDTQKALQLIDAAQGDVTGGLALLESAGGDTELALKALSEAGGNVALAMGAAGLQADDFGVKLGTDVPTGAQKAQRALEELGSVDVRFKDTLSPSMREAVNKALAAAQEMPNGVSTTLDNGQTVVATSMDELAGILPQAIRDANRKAYIEALKTPGEIADAILAGKEELDPIRQAIHDALVNGVSDARVQAAAQAELFGPALRRGLEKTGFTETQAKDLINAEALVSSVLAVEPDLFKAGTKLPPAVARGYRSLRQSVIQAVRDVNDDQSLTAEEVADALEKAGEDGLAALVRGVKSKKQDVKDAQDEINNAILERARGLANPMLVEGANASDRFGDGIATGIGNAKSQTSLLVNSVKGQLVFDATALGRGVGTSYVNGVVSGISTSQWLISGKVDEISRLLGFARSPMFHYAGVLGEGVAETYSDALASGLSSIPTDIRSQLDAVTNALRVSTATAPIQVAPVAVQQALSPTTAPALAAAAAATPAAQPPVVQEVHNHTHLEVRGFIPEPTTPADIRRELRRLELFRAD